MRRKLVLWGSNAKDEKMLVALELLEKENVVHIYTFPESIATQELDDNLSKKWKDDIEVEFPDGFTKIERKLSVSDSLLPDDIKVERPDLITRAQAEWHFVVLSSKLYGMYKAEMEEFKEKIDALTSYDKSIWDELVTFWAKVQDQVNEKNLFREHGASLREKSNTLFERLKELKKSFESEFETQSKKYMDSFQEELHQIEEKIEKGMGLAPLFEDLKKIQQKIKDFQFTRKDRDNLWNKIDDTFKKLKEKRGNQGGGSNQGNSELARTESRYKGLLSAIQKMQTSVNFDQKDLDYESKRAANSDGQLESQLRQAKINMIAERIKSKQDKVDDMLKTKAELEAKIEREKKKAIKVEKQEKLDEAKEVVKQKIASGITENAKELDKMSDKLEKAASELVKKPVAKTEGSFLDKLSDSFENLVEDVVDTAKAVAEVVSEKLETAMDKAEDFADVAEDKLEDIKDKAEDKFDDIKDKAEDKFDEFKDAAKTAFADIKETADNLEDKAEDKFDDIKEDTDDLGDKAAEKFDEIKEIVADKLEDIKDAASTTYENIKNSISDTLSDGKEEVADVTEKVVETTESVEDVATETTENVSDVVEDNSKKDEA
jgi:DNA repair exonuclease SbcCD ATPase subunit